MGSLPLIMCFLRSTLVLRTAVGTASPSLSFSYFSRCISPRSLVLHPFPFPQFLLHPSIFHPSPPSPSLLPPSPSPVYPCLRINQSRYISKHQTLLLPDASDSQAHNSFAQVPVRKTGTERRSERGGERGGLREMEGEGEEGGEGRLRGWGGLMKTGL